MRNATPTSVRVKPVQWTVLPADSEPITFTSASEMDRWFASHPEVDPLTVPMWRNRRRLNGLAPQPTLW